METIKFCGPLTETEQDSLQDWLSEVKKELCAETYAKSQWYGFDFEAGRAICSTSTEYFWKEEHLPKAETPEFFLEANSQRSTRSSNSSASNECQDSVGNTEDVRANLL